MHLRRSRSARTSKTPSVLRKRDQGRVESRQRSSSQSERHLGRSPGSEKSRSRWRPSTKQIPAFVGDDRKIPRLPITRLSAPVPLPPPKWRYDTLYSLHL